MKRIEPKAGDLWRPRKGGRWVQVLDVDDRGVLFDRGREAEPGEWQPREWFAKRMIPLVTAGSIWRFRDGSSSRIEVLNFTTHLGVGVRITTPGAQGPIMPSFRPLVVHPGKARTVMQPRARRLAAIAAWINENRPELEATIARDYCNTDRRLAGTRFIRRGKGREGNRIVVRMRKSRKVLLDHNAAETYRMNHEVESWLAKYLEDRS